MKRAKTFVCGCSFRKALKLLPVWVRGVTTTEIKPEEARVAVVIGGKRRRRLCKQTSILGCKDTGGCRVLLALREPELIWMPTKISW